MKSLIKQLLREELEFVDDTRDSYKGEAKKTIRLYNDDDLVAYADYSVVGDTAYIDMIEALEKGKGYGQMIMKHLAGMYGYENLERSSLTDDGAKMRAKLDKHYNFDYNRHKKDKSPHLKMEVIHNIKNPMIKNILLDLIENGHSNIWEKYRDNPEFIKLNDEILPQYEMDFNDIYDVSSWVRGSKTNDRYPDDEVPRPILKDLAKLFKIK